MRAKQHQRAYRIRTAQCDFFAMFLSQRFGDEEVTVKPVRQTKSSGDPERQPNIDIAERTTNAWAEKKARANATANKPKAASPFPFRLTAAEEAHGVGKAEAENPRSRPA